MSRSLGVLVLLLIVGVVAALTASGTACAKTTRIDVTWVQFPIAAPSGGRTWTEGRITHVRDQVIPTLGLWADSAGDSWATLIILTDNFDLDENGVGTTWGKWTEYAWDWSTFDGNWADWTTGQGALLVENDLFQGRQFVPMYAPPPEHAYGVVNILGNGPCLGSAFGPGHLDASAICYTGADPAMSPSGLWFVGTGTFLVPGG